MEFQIHHRPVHLMNNYWMRFSMISWIIKTEDCVICWSRRLRQITQTRGFDNSWYHVETEFNNCFIIHFWHNSSSETEAKHSAILWVYLGVRTCEVFLCFVDIVRVRVYYVDFFVFFVLRHWWVSQVFTPR